MGRAAGSFAGGGICLYVFADRIQRAGGGVEITAGVIETELRELTYKLYRPADAALEKRRKF